MNALYRFILLCTAVLMFVLCPSCGQSAGGGASSSSAQNGVSKAADVVVYIPHLPQSSAEYAASITGCTLLWYDEQAALRAQQILLGSTCHIQVAKNTATPVLAYPLIDGKEFFLPAGNVYPNQLKSGALYLSWECGTGAQILHSLLQAPSPSIEEKQYFCSYFNWEKLQAEIEKKENRRLIDIQKIAQTIAGATMSASAVKEKKSEKVVFSGSAVLYLASCDITQPSVRSGESFVLAEDGEVFYSDKGFVFVEKKKGMENTLVITELAR